MNKIYVRITGETDEELGVFYIREYPHTGDIFSHDGFDYVVISRKWDSRKADDEFMFTLAVVWVSKLGPTQ